jgi:hypothetical protein
MLRLRSEQTHVSIGRKKMEISAKEKIKKGEKPKAIPERTKDYRAYLGEIADLLLESTPDM